MLVADGHVGDPGFDPSRTMSCAVAMVEEAEAAGGQLSHRGLSVLGMRSLHLLHRWDGRWPVTDDLDDSLALRAVLEVRSARR